MATKRGRGRPLKLTPELQATIVNYIQNGNYVETAAAGAGINKLTIYRWLHAGKNAKSGIYRDFCNAVETALAKSEMADIGIINKAAIAGDWKASAWRLERKFPKRWGPGSLKIQNMPPEEEARQMSDEELLASMAEDAASLS